MSHHFLGIWAARCFDVEAKYHEQRESEVLCLYLVIIWYLVVAKWPAFTKKSIPLTYFWNIHRVKWRNVVVCLKESKSSMFQSIRLDPNSGVRLHNLVPGHRMLFVDSFGFCCWWICCRWCGAPLDIWGASQLRTGCLSILMLLTPLAEVTP